MWFPEELSCKPKDRMTTASVVAGITTEPSRPNSVRPNDAILLKLYAFNIPPIQAIQYEEQDCLHSDGDIM